MSLQPGQVIRYNSALWRVDYVNECRARIVPLLKRHVVLKDDDGNEARSFDAERGGVNISPNAEVPIVTDIDRAKDELELEAAEAELRAAQREVARPVPAAPKPPRKQAQAAPGPRTGAGWGVGPVSTPPLRDGSLADLVLSYITEHPGLGTPALVAALPAVANMPQCVSRLKLTGYIRRL